MQISRILPIRYLILFSFFNLFCISLKAQSVSFTTSAPQAVAKGEQFRLTYRLENANGRDLKIKSDIKDFDVLYGPSTSSSSSIQIINGRRSSSSSVSYIFILSSTKEGTFTIPGATIEVDGKTLSSSSVQVKVLPANQSNSSNNQAQTSTRRADVSSSSTNGNILSSDAFIRAIVSKSKVYEQEAFVVTFRLYTTLNVQDIGSIEFPEFNNFMIEDQDLSSTRQLKAEHYNGRNYYTADLRRVLLFPQKSGEITIPSGKIQMVFSVPSKTIETFFGPQYIMSDVAKDLKTNPIKINVLPLPNEKPIGFSNAIGSFSINSSISSQHITANEAITLKLNITGTGNMKLIKTPVLELPKEFENYDPKVTNDFKFSDNGLTGTKTIEYLFIPRYPGTYTIPSINFSYLNPSTGKYESLKTEEYSIVVDKDPNATNLNESNNLQSSIKVENDIRHLKSGEPKFVETKDFLFGSLAYILWYIIPFLLFVLILFFYRQRIKENSDLIALRKKKANKIATKRLKLAAKYLKINKKELFYEEVLRATWGYLSDKLNIPGSLLNRDNVESELLNYGATKGLAVEFISILDTCEFAQYAPTESSAAMDNLYDDVVVAIGKMENTNKN